MGRTSAIAPTVMSTDIDPDGSQRLEMAREARRTTSRPRLRFGRIIAWLVRASLIGLAASALLVAALRFVPPPTSAFMLREHLAALVERRSEFQIRQEWVGWSRISPHAAIAVVAAEDQRFRQHRGFDMEAMREAWTAYQSGKRLRGASTITQQVAKNLFLWPDRSYWRKGLEAYFTLLIETLWPKRRILEVYLNVAQFGEGLYGVEAASRALFAKSAADITPAEAALLAAVLPNPSELDASAPSGYVRERQSWILRQMRQLGGPEHLADL